MTFDARLTYCLGSRLTNDRSGRARQGARQKIDPGLSPGS
jgi:hypothetical protein